jgi:hypothetical protein
MSHSRSFSIARFSTFLYLIAPSFLFAVGWLKWYFALINVIILAYFVFVVAKDFIKQDNARRNSVLDFGPKIEKRKLIINIIVFLCLVIWVMLSGTGGFGFQGTDYRASNALLKDLVLRDWPINLTVGGVEGRIVYYMAYYLPAAVIGKVFGWVAANYFIVLWTLLGICLSFSWFVFLSRVDLKNKPEKLLGLLIIFCLAGGLDLFGVAYLRNADLRISTQNEWWAGYFQYSSNTTLIYWVPQQTISTWLLIGMIVDAYYNVENRWYLIMAMSVAVIWSPLGVIGAFPFYVLVIIAGFQEKKCNNILNKKLIGFNFLSMWIGVVHLLYIGSNQLKFPMGFSWEGVEDQGRLIKYIFAFWFLEFLFLSILITAFMFFGVLSGKSRMSNARTRRNWRALLEKNFDLPLKQLYIFLISLICLFLLPVFRLGIYNDLVMRSSVPSLFIFWAMVAKILIDSTVRVRIRHNFLYSMIMAVLIIGFYPAMRNILDSVEKYHFGPPEISSVATSAEANSPDIVLQRMGNMQSFFYIYLGK